MRDWRRARLFGPIVAMTLTGLMLLVLLSFFLIQRFDKVASDREAAMVSHGFARQVAELDDVIATQVEWDDAVASLDRKFDPDWADFNLGNYLYTFHGFSNTFVIDASGKPFYAAYRGERADLATYDRFASTAAGLVPGIRQAEQARPPLGPRPGKNNIKVPSIQDNTVARINGEAFLVTATLVQPDFGKVLPKGSQAPIAVAALPLDKAYLNSFAQRYMLGGLRLADQRPPNSKERHLALQIKDGAPAVTLAWTPRQPGTMIFDDFRTEAILSLTFLALLGLLVVKRGSAIVTELIASEARSKHLAYHDVLTRLPNRALLFERMAPMLASAGTPGNAVAVICVDLDRFKAVNDTYGHHAGDLLIEEVAERLRRTCKTAQLIARQGGDEFVVLCQPSNHAVARELGEAILAVMRRPLETEHGRIEVGCSIGVAIIDRFGIEASEALRWSDLALYRSKQLGRNQVSLFEADMDEARRRKQSMETDLRQALANRTFAMVYQPQAGRNGEIAAVESLLRWTLPDGQAIPPSQFVPLAEECGLIQALGEFVLRQVFEETRSWLNLRVAINISPLQLRLPDFADRVERLVKECRIDPRRYEIELTETALLGDEPVIAANVEALKGQGFSLALDDFGTGYSSLSLLQRFAVDRIKIDRSFVRGLDGTGESDALVDAMVKLANALGLSVIAEGVETEAQFLRLMHCGCREFQGHLIGMPKPAAETEILLGLRRSERKPVRQRA